MIRLVSLSIFKYLHTFSALFILTLGLVILVIDDSIVLEYEKKSVGTRLLVSNGIEIKTLVDKTNLGGNEVEVGETTFPRELWKRKRTIRNSVEFFYVLSGVLGHTVNGKQHVIIPGMIAITRPGDKVIHTVLSETPVKALVISVPGDESERPIKNFGYKALPLSLEKN